MFYKTGIDITNDKQMFEFLAGHYTYPTMSYHNYSYSIANKVKLHSLGLSGDWCVAYNLLENGEYETLHLMIKDWEAEHPGYEVYFNGRSGGYLVLKEQGSHGNVLPDIITESENYDEYKKFCREDYGSVKANRGDLVFYTNLVRDFDRLCNELRDYCDSLSKLKFEIVEMERAVEQFNSTYKNDLEMLGFQLLECDEEGVVDLHEILMLQSLTEAFIRLAHRDRNGYSLAFIETVKVKLVESL